MDVSKRIISLRERCGLTQNGLAEKAGVSLEETLAIGDSDNDLPMILKAGLGVAMKNGEEHVKAAAGYITERTAEEHGVAEVLEKFIL